LYNRVRDGWNLEKALTTPIKYKRRSLVSLYCSLQTKDRIKFRKWYKHGLTRDQVRKKLDSLLNKERCLASARNYKSKNREKENIQQRKWRANNRIRCRAYDRKRAQLIKNTPDNLFLLPEKLVEIYDEYVRFNGLKCEYCFSVVDDLTIDHVMPLSRGGFHEKDNIKFCCLSCNSKKKDILILDFIDRLWFNDNSLTA